LAALLRHNFKAAAVTQLIQPSNIARRIGRGRQMQRALVGEGRAALWSRPKIKRRGLSKHPPQHWRK
jgi:hypothetical protein